MIKNTNSAGQPIICQLLSFLPRDIVETSVKSFKSDRYYKTMTTYKQLVFILYGIVSKSQSLNQLCKNIIFLDGKLSYLGITDLPAKSTLSDANINRCSDVFGDIYQKLCLRYKDEISPKHYGLVKDEILTDQVKIIDSSTISLFVDIFKGAGRNSINGKKKGGIKIHAQAPLGGSVPDLVHLTEAASNDKNFLGQLNSQKGSIYVFDKGYVNYQKWYDWTEKGVFYVTRLNENANFIIVKNRTNHVSEYADGGIISDQEILLNHSDTGLKARLIHYKDPESGKLLKFISNMFDYDTSTICQLYKYRWGIEVMFKRLKQNFELSCFYSDSSEGIKTQIWITLIANLIFTVIHKQCKEAEVFTILVSMAAMNLVSYISLIKIVTMEKLDANERNLLIVQYYLFDSETGGVLNKSREPT